MNADGTVGFALGVVPALCLGLALLLILCDKWAQTVESSAWEMLEKEKELEAWKAAAERDAAVVEEIRQMHKTAPYKIERYGVEPGSFPQSRKYVSEFVRDDVYDDRTLDNGNSLRV